MQMDSSRSTSLAEMICNSDQKQEDVMLNDFLNDLDDIPGITLNEIQTQIGDEPMTDINEEFGLYIPDDDLSDCSPGHMGNKQPEEKPGDEEKNAGKGFVEETSTVIAKKPIPRKPRTKRPELRSFGGFSFSKLVKEPKTTLSPCASVRSNPYCSTSMKEEAGASNKSIQTEKERKKKCNNDHQKKGKACTHCGTQKTPLWRSGPMGSKTLCNACGVRYKSGRLYPEYRPAASPTYSADKHSNSHKKVLEMRRNKEAFH